MTGRAAPVDDRRDVVIKIAQRAARCPGFSVNNRLSLQYVGDSCFEFIGTSVVFQIAGGIEDRGFGSHGGVASFLQFVIGVAQGDARKLKLGHVILEGPLVFFRFGVNEIERDMAALEVLGDAAQFRGRLVEGWAVRAGEQKDLDIAGIGERPAEQKQGEALHSFHCTTNSSCGFRSF